MANIALILKIIGEILIIIGNHIPLSTAISQVSENIVLVKVKYEICGKNTENRKKLKANVSIV